MVAHRQSSAQWEVMGHLRKAARGEAGGPRGCGEDPAPASVWAPAVAPRQQCRHMSFLTIFLVPSCRAELEPILQLLVLSPVALSLLVPASSLSPKVEMFLSHGLVSTASVSRPQIQACCPFWGSLPRPHPPCAWGHGNSPPNRPASSPG